MNEQFFREKSQRLGKENEQLRHKAEAMERLEADLRKRYYGEPPYEGDNLNLASPSDIVLLVLNAVAEANQEPKP